MLGTLRNPPKVVTVRVNKAAGLRNTYIEGKKHRKDNFKWKVKIKGGKKTLESYTINDPNGNPVWDFEATLEIVDVSQPVVIKITDSDDHDVGQVVIPLVQIPPRPINASTKPLNETNIRIGELEPTRKVSEVFGKIYYCIWADSFFEDSGLEKSSKGSMISLDKVHRSASRLSSHLHRHRDKDDGTSVAGSQISMYSTASKKNAHWYKQNPIKKIKEKHSSAASHLSSGSRHGGGSELGYSMSQSMSSLFPQEHDGSVLGGGAGGGHSGNGSEIFGGSNADSSGLDFKMPTAENPFPRVGSTRRSSRGRSPSSELNSETPVRPQNRPSKREPPKPLNLEKKAHSPSASSDEGEDTHGQPLSATVPQSANPFQDSPTLISISPSIGPPSTETEVHVYGKSLSSSVMRHAVLLVDDYTVANYKWSVSEGSWPEEPQATHRITFKVPPKKDAFGSGKVWIDVETMEYGRLRCPTPFVYQATEKSLPTSEPPAKLLESTFIRNSSIRLSDNRARRSVRKPPEAAPLKAVSPPTTEGGGLMRNSSIRLSDTRGHRGNRGAKPPQPTLPSTNEIPSSIGNRSSGLGSEESFSESNPPLSFLSTTLNSTEDLNVGSLADAEAVIAKLKGEVSELTSELSRKSEDVDRVSGDLCRLRNPTPPKTEKSGFVRNSSIRLSDTRARRGIREPTNPESEKPKETAQIEVPAAQAIETTASKAPEPLKEEKNGFIRNSSIRLSDTRSRRNAREDKSLTESSKETEASAPTIIPSVKPVEATPPKAPEPTKPGSSGFTRNSSIRLSDTRARRSIRENKPDALKEVSVVGAATAAVSEANASETYESLRPKNGGFIRNSSIRLSDTRARRSMRETKPSPSETPIESNTKLGKISLNLFY
ncbi:unnamed protein product [Hymenolepis diminuta]|uniref:C2 domain-containing protein n=1 Tax=Hymenolepis diminuta TaxID=6216 RepID=A0A0R3SIL3_HYMDI|nr:unnamed protein product [Hymenolepis diminuta]